MFGFDATSADVTLVSRSRRWRAGQAARVLAVTVVAAPFLALVPPHAPWALGALGAGIFLARRRWAERFTLIHLKGSCPRCGTAVNITAPTRLRIPHPVECDHCRHDGVLLVGSVDR
jgi:hypothetical protein